MPLSRRLMLVAAEFSAFAALLWWTQAHAGLPAVVRVAILAAYALALGWARFRSGATYRFETASLASNVLYLALIAGLGCFVLAALGWWLACLVHAVLVVAGLRACLMDGGVGPRAAVAA